MIAYAQNGEPLRPAQSYPARLFLPGWEGNANVKWLRRIELADRPFMTQFSVTDTDTAHRFLFRGTFALDAWTVSPVFEGRQGFPFSAVDEDQNFVGARNQGGRFPHVWVLDFHIQRGLRIYGFNTRVGVRVFHLFESDFPQDVQSNIDAPTFGLFSNQVERSIGLTFRIDM